MIACSQIAAITTTVASLGTSLAQRSERLDRIGACMDDPSEPIIIVRVQHGKILDIVASDAITAMPADELQNLLNAAIFGAFIDWSESMKKT